MNVEQDGPRPLEEPSPATVAGLAKERNVWLITKRRSGPPHVTPVWFVVSGSGLTWWICTSARSVKVHNIVDQPKVALALMDGRRPVVAEGKARIHHDEFPPSVVAAFAEKYTDFNITVRYSARDPLVLVEVSTQG